MRSHYICVSFLAFLLWPTANIESEMLRSSITGIVTGPDGSRIPGVLITARIGTESAAQVISNSRGMYRTPELLPGKYEVTAQLDGFETCVISDLLIVAGTTRTVDLNLQVATIRETVTVIGTSPQNSIELVQSRESSAKDVGEAMAEESGIWKLRKGGIANDIVLRGFQSKDLNVLIDGQRIYGACPNQMDPPSFHIDFAEVDRIEIAKGPFDVKNQGSMAGVVNIVTRKPEKRIHFSGSVSIGSYGFVNPSATFSLGREAFSFMGGYSYRLSDPYQDGTGRRFTESVNYRADALDSSAFRAGTVWGHISGSPFSNHFAHLSYARQQANHVLYPYLQMDAIYDDTDRINAGYKIDNPGGFIRSLRFQGYFTRVNHWMTDQYRSSSPRYAPEYSMGTLASTSAAGGKMESRLQMVTVGIEAFRREWRGQTLLAGQAYAPQFSIPDVRTDNIGLYSEYSRSFSDRLKISMGGRIDSVTTAADTSLANTSLYFAYNATRSISTTNNLPSGNVRLTHKIPIGIEISGGVGHAVRVPDARERYFALARMGSDWVGNPSLRPSRNTGFDAGISFRRKSLLLESSFYLYRVHDYVVVVRQTKINPIPGIMNSLARSYQNVDARLRGGELLVSYLLTRSLFFSSDLSWVRGTSHTPTSVLDADLPEMPPMRARAGVRYETAKIMAELEGVWSGAQRNVDTLLGEQSTAGYGIANLKVGINFKRAVLRAGLNNIFSRTYFEYLSYQRDPFRSGIRVYEPGGNFFVNLSYRY